MMVGVNGGCRGLRKSGYPFLHVRGEDRVPLADHVRCGYLPVSGRTQWLANRAQRVRAQPRDCVARNSWSALAEEERARVIRQDAIAVLVDDPPVGRHSCGGVD